MSTKAEQNLRARAQLFKALGNPTRLLIVNLIRLQPRHTEELASILKLSPGTVSHHLSSLSDAGLLSSKKEQYYQVYSLVKGVLDKPLLEVVSMPQPSLDKNVEQDAYTQKVLKTFFKRGRLVKIPSQQKKFVVVIKELVKNFEPEKVYSERDVNIILADFHDDFATLRRGLVDFRMMERSRDGRDYRRVNTQEPSVGVLN